MENKPEEDILPENKNVLSHQPSQELLDILVEFKNAMVKPTEIFDKFVKKAREENFSDFEINLLLSRKELRDAIPEGSMNYYKKKYGLPIQDYKIARLTLRKLDNNVRDFSIPSEGVRLPPREEVIQEVEPIEQESELEKFRQEKSIKGDQVIRIKVDASDTKDLHFELTKLRQTKGFLKGFILEIDLDMNSVRFITA